MPAKKLTATSIRLVSIVKFIGVIGIFLVFLETVSWLYFHHHLYPPLRDSALYCAYGVLPDERRIPAPKIQPYLWANYMPNPQSPEANSYGWRYGGGPKGQGIFRILCIGGSTTWSEKASGPKQSYPAQLETFLRTHGFAVDVVNGGCGYFTSAELVGTLAFRGIYTEPDLVIIHTGGNDTAPLRSPREYRPDYTHWRTVDPSLHNLSRTEKFRVFWKVPLWSWRLYITLRLEPNAFYRRMVATQLDTPQDGLLSQSDVNSREPIGLENNLRTLISIARAHGASAATVTFGMPLGNLSYLLPQMESDPELKKRVIGRAGISLQKSNSTILKVSHELGVPVVPFHEFQPSSAQCWVDQCHLDDEGCTEKAEFIGNFLVENRLIPERYRRQAEPSAALNKE